MSERNPTETTDAAPRADAVATDSPAGPASPADEDLADELAEDHIVRSVN